MAHNYKYTDCTLKKKKRLIISLNVASITEHNASLQ